MKARQILTILFVLNGSVLLCSVFALAINHDNYKTVMCKMKEFEEESERVKRLINELINPKVGAGGQL